MPRHSLGSAGRLPCGQSLERRVSPPTILLHLLGSWVVTSRGLTTLESCRLTSKLVWKWHL